MQEWFNWHAWKACVPQKGTGGSNPPLSAGFFPTGKGQRVCTWEYSDELTRREAMTKPLIPPDSFSPAGTGTGKQVD